MANGNDDLQEFGWEPEQSEGQEDLTEFGWEPEVPEKEEYSSAEAAGLGALEGTTLGFSDEIGAAGQALYGELTGRGDITEEDMREAGIDPKEFPDLAQKKSLLDRYREIRDLGREGYKEAQEQQPGAFFAGSMVGGAAIPGMGAVRGTRAAAKAYKAARLAGKSTSAARQIAGLKALGKASQVGAGAGAVVGAGISEADLTEGEVGDFTEDVGQSAAIGAGLAGPGVAGAKAVGKLGKGIVKTVKELPPVRPFKTGFKTGIKGKGTFTEELREEAEKDLYDVSKELTGDIKEEIGRQAQIKRKVLEETADQVDYGEVSNVITKRVDDLKRKGFSTLSGKDVKKLTTVANELSTKEPTAKRADEIRRFIQQYTIAGDKSLDTSEGRRIALEAVGGLQEQIEKASGSKKQLLEEANRKMSKLLESQGLLKTDQPTYNEIQHLKNAEAFSNWLSRSMESGPSGMKTRFRLRKVEEALKESNPDLADEIMQKIKEGKDLTQALAESGGNISGFFQIALTKFPSLTGNILGYNVARGKSALTKKMADSPIAEKATELSTQIRGMVQHAIPEDLQEMSQKFYNAGEEQIGNAFRKASGMKNERRRQAILMGLMQQPKVREILKDEELGETQDEQ